MSEQEFLNPPSTDFHGRKRELLRQGVEDGRLKWATVMEQLDEEFFSAAEIEVFLFTCDQMGIEIEDRPVTFTSREQRKG